MNGRKINPMLGENANRPRHGLRNIKELEIGKHVFIMRIEPINQFVVLSGHKEFKTNLVEADRVPQRLYQILSLFDARNIKRHNEPLVIRNGFR